MFITAHNIICTAFYSSRQEFIIIRVCRNYSSYASRFNPQCINLEEIK